MTPDEKNLRHRIEEGSIKYASPMGKLIDLCLFHLERYSSGQRSFTPADKSLRLYRSPHLLGNTGATVIRSLGAEKGRSFWEYAALSDTCAAFDQVTATLPPNHVIKIPYRMRYDLKQVLSRAIDQAISNGTGVIQFDERTVSIRSAPTGDTVHRVLTLVRYERGHTMEVHQPFE